MLDEARRWIGVPFLHQGRRRTGVDCIGLVIVTLQAVGRLPPDFERTDYGRIPNRDELQQKIAAYCTRLEHPEPGCMLTLRWNRLAGHTALYTGETIIHAYQRIGYVVEHGYRGPWIRRTDAAWRLP